MKVGDEVIPSDGWGSNVGDPPARAFVMECYEDRPMTEYLILTSDNRRLLVYDYEIENVPTAH